jgi:hypothetical protein
MSGARHPRECHSSPRRLADARSDTAACTQDPSGAHPRRRRTCQHQAEAFLRRFPDWGRYGLSAYYARDDAEVDDLAADQLERFPVLAVLTVAELEADGFMVVPTFRTPHVTIAFTGDLTDRLDALAALVTRVIENPYHDEEPEE